MPHHSAVGWDRPCRTARGRRQAPWNSTGFQVGFDASVGLDAVGDLDRLAIAHPRRGARTGLDVGVAARACPPNQAAARVRPGSPRSSRRGPEDRARGRRGTRPSRIAGAAGARQARPARRAPGPAGRERRGRSPAGRVDPWRSSYRSSSMARSAGRRAIEARMSSRTFGCHGGVNVQPSPSSRGQVEAPAPGGQPRRAQGADLGGVGAPHRAVDQVGQQLHQHVVARGPAVDVQLGQGAVQVGLHGHRTSSWIAGPRPPGAARARWAEVVPRFMPLTGPRASSFQCGAPRPARAGTTQTPPVAATEAARAVRAVSSFSPNSWVMKAMAWPETEMLPSRACQGAGGLAPGDRAGQAMGRPDAGVGDGHQGRAGAAGGLDPAGAVDPVAVEGGDGSRP